MTATRSPSVKASVWSCVTYTAVSPSSSNSAAEVLEQAVAKPAVERAERLVEEEHARLGRERAGERDALLLAARERSHRAPLEAGEADEVEQLACPRCDSLGRVAAHPQPESDVAGDVAVGEERVILEDETDPAPVRGHCCEIGAVEQHSARSRAPGARQ